MSILQRIGGVMKLWFRYTIDFWKANLGIAKQVLSPRLEIAPETIVMETKVKSPLEILTLANLITFTPGTLVVGIDPEKRLEVHVLSEGDEVRGAIPRDLEKPILDITRKDSHD